MSSGGSLALRLAAAGAFVLCIGVSGAAAAGGSATVAAAEVSWAGSKDAWEVRDTGVFSTETGGRSWHRIYDEPAITILRLSATTGVIELGSDPGPCMCTTRKLWTNDDGTTWHSTDAIGTNFTGAGSELYWWQGGDLHLISPFPPASSSKPLEAKLVSALPDGTIVASTRTALGFAFLVSNRVAGQHWDTSPRVILSTAEGTQTVTLPSAPSGSLLAGGIDSADGVLTVTATNYGTEPVAQVNWTSADNGQTWSLGS
ncbi:MAG TPA: hypothetical protein VH063_16700 [Gaiellaceae bacterium]|nr:hypothetical protein [Gaiellaceae bacterium]